MRAVHPAVPVGELAHVDFLDAEFLDAHAGQHDVRDGIERPDLVEADGFHRRAVDFRLGFCDAAKNAQRVFLDEVREVTRLQQRADFDVGAAMGMLAAVIVLMFMGVLMLMFMLMLVGVLMFMFMPVFVGMLMLMLMGVGMNLAVLIGVLVLFVGVRAARVDAEFHSLDVLALLALEVHVKIPDVQLGKLPLERGRLHSQVAERADGHVAADARKAVEKENSHRAIRPPRAALP